MGKSYGKGATWGSSKWNSQLFFSALFSENLNCGQCINDKQITFCVLQIGDKLSLNYNQNNLVRFLSLPITAPSKKP